MKIDLHAHTSYGSACSYMEPDQLIESAKAAGLDGVCITEHNQFWSPEAVLRLRKKHDFLVISGAEVSTDCGEILVFGMYQSVVNVFKAKKLKRMVAKAGGVMVLAHPFRTEHRTIQEHLQEENDGSDNGSTNLEAVCERPVFSLIDALEVYNGRSGLSETDFAALVAERLNLGSTGGSDAHGSLAVGSCYTVFENNIESEQEFIAEIKGGRFYGVDPRWQKYNIAEEIRRLM